MNPCPAIVIPGRVGAPGIHTRLGSPVDHSVHGWPGPDGPAMTNHRENSYAIALPQRGSNQVTAIVMRAGARYLPRPQNISGSEIPMRVDVEAAKADIEQSIELLRRRL